MNSELKQFFICATLVISGVGFLALIRDIFISSQGGEVNWWFALLVRNLFLLGVLAFTWVSLRVISELRK